MPGLPELVEVHAGRLGQTGEQTAVTRSVSHARPAWPKSADIVSVCPRPKIASSSAPCSACTGTSTSVSATSSTMRGFWIRDRWTSNICIPWVPPPVSGRESRPTSGSSRNTCEAYRGYGVPLSPLVTESAKFGTDQVRFRRDFLRVSILPHSMNLYASELMTLLLKGELRNSFRLSLLPGLATAAALEQKITGSDKGIW